MPEDCLQALEQANHGLRSALVRLRSEQMHCSSITPQDFSDLLRQILRAAECLRVPPAVVSEGVQQATADFRENLQELKDFLPELHGHLLAEKSRLEAAQAHVSAAAAWAQSSTRTL